jgi:16S rRNA (guanine527-N7)-methyltransferase
MPTPKPQHQSAQRFETTAAYDPAQAADLLAQSAAQMGLQLGPDAVNQLLAYLALLLRWTKVYNLTALRQADDMLSHHLVDCLAVLPALHRKLAGTAKFASPLAAAPQKSQTAAPEGSSDVPLRVLDVGSGGGLPGVVLAICQPDWRVDCVDTVAKKVAFIRQVSAELHLPKLRGLHARVENLDATAQGGYQVITARAFASLHDFTVISRHLLASNGVWMAMKARLSEEEVAALPADVEVFHVEHLKVPGLQDAQRCLVWMRQLVSTNDTSP